LEINDRLFEKLDSILSVFPFHSIDVEFKRLDYALYKDGNIYKKGYSEPFFSSYDRPKMYKNTVIVSLEQETIEEIAVDLLSNMYETFLTTKYKMIIPNYLNIVESKHNFLQVNYYLYEIKILKQADRAKDLNVKKAFLRLFVNIRHQRSEMNNGFTLDEMKAEHINGLIAYAYVSILRVIYGKKSIRVKEYLVKLNNRFDNFFNIMNGSYLTGLYLKTILVDLGYIVPPHTLLYNVCVAYIEYVSEIITLPKNNKAIKLIQNREMQSKEILNDFFLLDPKKVKFNGVIKTFDPASVLKFENRYYFNNFVVLEDLSGLSTYITGPVVVSTEKNNVVSYYRTTDID